MIANAMKWLKKLKIQAVGKKKVMKNLIEKLNLSIKEFAELYEIPYNTVRQWYNGTRQAPPYIKKLIEEITELKSSGIQLNIFNEKNDITEKGIRRTISVFEYIIYYKGQNGSFIKVPVDMLIEQFKGITKQLKEKPLEDLK